MIIAFKVVLILETVIFIVEAIRSPSVRIKRISWIILVDKVEALFVLVDIIVVKIVCVIVVVVVVVIESSIVGVVAVIVTIVRHEWHGIVVIDFIMTSTVTPPIVAVVFVAGIGLGPTIIVVATVATVVGRIRRHERLDIISPHISPASCASVHATAVMTTHVVSVFGVQVA